MKAYRDQSSGLTKIFITLLIIWPFLLLLSNSVYKVILPIFGLVILTVMCLLHFEHVQQDKARGVGKAKNAVYSVWYSGIILCLVGIVIIIIKSWDFSTSDPWDWALVIFYSFFIIRGVICFLAGQEYYKTVEHWEYYEARTESRIEYYKTWLEDLGCKIDEDGKVHRGTSRRKK